MFLCAWQHTNSSFLPHSTLNCHSLHASKFQNKSTSYLYIVKSVYFHFPSYTRIVVMYIWEISQTSYWPCVYCVHLFLINLWPAEMRRFKKHNKMMQTEWCCMLHFFPSAIVDFTYNLFHTMQTSITSCCIKAVGDDFCILSKIHFRVSHPQLMFSNWCNWLLFCFC